MFFDRQERQELRTKAARSEARAENIDQVRSVQTF